MQRANRPRVHRAIAKDSYALIYPHLLEHFKSLPKSLDISQLLTALNIVYGWMPTIARPESSLRVLETDSAKLLKLVKRARESQSPNLNVEQLELLIRFANNSSVGASKLLHFFNPGVYAIWDSRVAMRFMWATVAEKTYNTSYRLIEYTDTLWNWSQDDGVSSTLKKLRRLHSHLESLSDMRLLELVLFHPPVRKRKEVSQSLARRI